MYEGHFIGCMWRTLGRTPKYVLSSDPKGMRAPTIPFSRKRCSLNANLLHPHGQPESWFAHPWRAVRTWPFMFTKLLKRLLNSANLLSSYRSSSRCASVSASHSGKNGRKSLKIGGSGKAGKGLRQSLGMVGFMSRHHHRFLRVGISDSNRR